MSDRRIDPDFISKVLKIVSNVFDRLIAFVGFFGETAPNDALKVSRQKGIEISDRRCARIDYLVQCIDGGIAIEWPPPGRGFIEYATELEDV